MMLHRKGTDTVKIEEEVSSNLKLKGILNDSQKGIINEIKFKSIA